MYYIEAITPIIKYIKISILSTHGASNTYMNQVFLLENMPNIKCTENSAENSFIENSIESDKPLKDQSFHNIVLSPVEESFQIKKNPFRPNYQISEKFELTQPFQSVKSYHLPKIDEVDRIKKEIAN